MDEVRKHVGQAVELLQQGKLRHAAAEFERAVRLVAGVPLPQQAAQEEPVAEPPRIAEAELEKLPRSPLFSALEKAAFEAVVRNLDLRWMTAGETLVREGEQGDSMFVVVQGVVNVMHGDRVIAVMAEGSFFGEMALVTDSPRLASVVAARDGLLFEVHRAKVSVIAARYPSVGKDHHSFYCEPLVAE